MYPVEKIGEQCIPMNLPNSLQIQIWINQFAYPCK